MLRTKNKLTVLYDDNTSFTDYSAEALDYDRDSFTITIDSTNDYLYVGFYKPVNVFYIDSSTPNVNAGVFAGEYYNGTSFTALEGYLDETKSITRSGFIQWDRGQTDEAKTTVNSVEQYWYRFRPSANHSATVIKGLNIVFSDDQDLKREFFEVSSWLPLGETSFILTHIATRDHMMQEIRNNGNKKMNNAVPKDLTPFDLLDMPQIKLAATYLALSKIFSNITDDPDDTYLARSKEYMNLYVGAMNVFYLSLDTDDDGIVDSSEKLKDQTGTMVRR